MKQGITNIDTIKLMIESTSQIKQHTVLTQVKKLFSNIESVYIKRFDIDPDANRYTVEHKALYKGKQIVGLKTQRYRRGSFGDRSLRDVYAVSVSFYGLKQYHQSDIGSLECLLQLVIYLNSTETSFRINELDICYDIEAPFNNVLTVLNKKAPNVKYFEPDEPDGDGNIKRIEKVPRALYRAVTSRAYTYFKTAKNDWIQHDLVRFELKLNPPFFKDKPKPLRAIAQSLNKYTIMHFESLQTKRRVLERYKEQWDNNSLDIESLKIDKYKYSIDVDYIDEFISMLYTIENKSDYEWFKPTRDEEESIDSTSSKIEVMPNKEIRGDAPADTRGERL